MGEPNSSENMAKILAISLGVILSLAAAALFHQNRDSKALYPIYFSVFCAGALGFIVTALATLEVKPEEETFAVGCRFDSQGKIPVLDESITIGLQISSVAHNYTQELKDRSYPKGAIPLVSEATRRAVVTEMFKLFTQSWNIEVREYKTFAGKSIQWGGSHQSSTKFGVDDFLDFFDCENPLAGIFRNEVHCPPGTKVGIIDESISRTLTLSNRFLKLSVKVREGSYRALADEYLPYYAECYVDISAEYTQWLAGHPQMEDHRKWAGNLIQSLKNLESKRAR